jgi:signal peptidase I
MGKKIIIVSSILILTGIVGLVVLQYLFFKNVRVPTSSMSNTIVPGDCLVAHRLFGGLKRGDLVIFAYSGQPSIYYVSRVVGLPGETIFVRDALVYVNGQPIPEQRVYVKYPYDFEYGVMDETSTEGSGPYRVYYFQLDENPRRGGEPDMTFAVREPFHIPDNQYFMMSDNRDNSLDSRFKGPVPLELIWGKPTMIYWSSHADQSHQERVKWDRIGKEVR